MSDIVTRFNRFNDFNYPDENFIITSSQIVSLKGYFGKLKWVSDKKEFYIYAPQGGDSENVGGWITLKSLMTNSTLISDYDQTTPYKLYECVKYGDAIYVSLISSNVMNINNINAWMKLLTTVIENYVQGTSYKINTIVKYSDNFYISLINGNTTLPTTTNWVKIKTSFVDTWIDGKYYNINDIVSYIVNEHTEYYISKSVSNNHNPTNIQYWTPIITPDNIENYSLTNVIMDYDSTLSYDKNVIVNNEGTFYVSLENSNIYQLTDETKWIKILTENISEQYESITNKVTTIDENSTDTQYPSAKLLYEKTKQLSYPIAIGYVENGYNYQVIDHNLNKKPMVKIIRSDNNNIICNIIYIDNNSLKISWIGDLEGYIYVN